MQRKTIYLLAILILAIFAVFLLTVYHNTKIKKDAPAIQNCNSDSDCFKSSKSCCPCNMGGEEICISKSQEENHSNKLKCSEYMACPAVFSCSDKECSCINGICTLK
jgi:hypothetical protein